MKRFEYLPLVVIIAFLFGIFFFFWTVRIAFVEVRDNKFPLKVELVDLNSGLVKIPKKAAKIDTIIIDQTYYSIDSTKTKVQEITNKSIINYTPKLMIWVLFNAAVVGFCATFFILLCSFLVEINSRKYFRIKLLPILSTLGAASIVFFVINHFFHREDIKGKYLGGADLMREMSLFFENPDRVIDWFNTPLLLVSCCTILSVLIMIWSANNLFSIDNVQFSTLKENYLYLKGRLNLLIAFLGFAVSGATIGAGLQRQLFLSAVEGGEMLYPIEFVYSFGFVFALILFLLYLPSFLFIQERARYAFFNSSAINLISDEAVKDDFLRESWMNNLKVALTISLPIISSILQNIIFSFD